MSKRRSSDQRTEATLPSRGNWESSTKLIESRMNISTDKTSLATTSACSTFWLMLLKLHPCLRRCSSRLLHRTTYGSSLSYSLQWLQRTNWRFWRSSEVYSTTHFPVNCLQMLWRNNCSKENRKSLCCFKAYRIVTLARPSSTNTLSWSGVSNQVLTHTVKTCLLSASSYSSNHLPLSTTLLCRMHLKSRS